MLFPTHFSGGNVKLEITIRAFYKSKEGIDAVPATSVLVDSEATIKLSVIAEALAKAVVEGPLHVTEMTEAEITAYLAKEKEGKRVALLPPNRHDRRAEAKKGIIRE